jgi:hypothetical protein
VCSVTYDVNKTNDTSQYVTENYDIYEHTTNKNKIIIKQKLESFNYEKLEENKKIIFL